MGEHKGWRVTKRGDVSVGWAWDPHSGKYQTKTMELHQHAKKWAMDQAARFRAKVDFLAAEGSTTKQIAVDYVSDLRRRGRSALHVADVERVLVGPELKAGEVSASFSGTVTDISHSRASTLACDWLTTRAGVSPRTRNKFLVYIQGMANWAVRRKRLPHNPFLAIDPEKESRLLKPQFTFDELLRMVNTDRCVWGGETAFGLGQHLDPVHLAMAGGAAGDPFAMTIIIMLYTGARTPSETSFLQWQHIDWAGEKILLFGKGQKERLVPLQKELADYLRPLKRDEGPVLTRGKGNMRRSFNAFLKRHGIPKGKRSPHSLRHGYAGLMTATGVSALLLRDSMGHSSTATTDGYAALASKYVSPVEGWPRGEFRFRQQ